MVTLVAATQLQAKAAMGTLHLIAVIMRMVQTTQGKPKVILQYVWKMIYRRSQVIQERKQKMVIQQMEVMRMLVEVDIQMAIPHIHCRLCFHKGITFHCAHLSLHLHILCQHMPFILLVLITFQLPCTLTSHFLCLLHQLSMVLAQCRFQQSARCWNVWHATSSTKCIWFSTSLLPSFHSTLQLPSPSCHGSATV